MKAEFEETRTKLLQNVVRYTVVHILEFSRTGARVFTDNVCFPVESASRGMANTFFSLSYTYSLTERFVLFSFLFRICTVQRKGRQKLRKICKREQIIGNKTIKRIIFSRLKLTFYTQALQNCNFFPSVYSQPWLQARVSLCCCYRFFPDPTLKIASPAMPKPAVFPPRLVTTKEGRTSVKCPVPE